MSDEEVEQTKKKDIWDKMSALSIPIASVVVGVTGAVLTYQNNQLGLEQDRLQAEAARQQERQQSLASLEQARLFSDRAAEFERFKLESDLRQQQQTDEFTRANEIRKQEFEKFKFETDLQARQRNNEATAQIAEAEALQQMFDFVSSTDTQKREFGYAMFAAMGQEQLAIKLIAASKDEAGRKVLEDLSTSSDPEVRRNAQRGLESLVNVQSSGGVTLAAIDSCRKFVDNGFRVDRVERLDDQGYAEIAGELGVEVAALKAFVRVQGFGLSEPSNSKIKILFERHLFHRITGGVHSESNPDISSFRFGGYVGGEGEFDRLIKAAKLDCPAALAATSWGNFGIIGNNYRAAGFQHVDDFVKAFIGSEKEQLKALGKFLKERNLLDELQRKDWRALARGYNGPQFGRQSYDVRLEQAYQKVVQEDEG